MSVVSADTIDAGPLLLQISGAIAARDAAMAQANLQIGWSQHRVRRLQPLQVETDADLRPARDPSARIVDVQ